MSSVAGYFQELSDQLGQGWNRFWFTPASPIPLARLRIATGFLALAYFLSWSTHLARILGSEGLLPPGMVHALLQEQNRHLYRFSPLYSIDAASGLTAYQVVATVVAGLFLCGVLTRVTSVLTLIALLTYIHRAPMLTGPLEAILTMLLLYLAVGPSGAAYSFDAWWASRQGKSPATPSWLASVSLRLVQVHLAGFIFLVACSMLASRFWWNGTAIWALEAQTLSRPFDLSSLRTFPKLMNAWAHLFVLVNLLFPVLVWIRLLRPLVVAVAIMFWLLMIPVSGQVLYVLAVISAMCVFCATDSAEKS